MKSLKTIKTVLLLLTSMGLSAQTFTVNSVADGNDSNTGDGICATNNMIGPNPECTLRAAVQEGNGSMAAVNIEFNIAGCPNDVCVLQRDNNTFGLFPDLVNTFNIDGSTQPGNAAVCTTAIPDRPAYKIVLTGDGVFGNAGFRLREGSDGSSIKGLNINDFYDNIYIQNSNHNTIACNFIGTDNTGTTGTELNTGNGVIFFCDSSNNTVGGINTYDGNLISGQDVDAVQFYAAFTCESFDQLPTQNAVLGNYLGTNKSATATIINTFNGVSFFGAANGADQSYVGVALDGVTINPNIIGGNDESGIYINDGRNNITIMGNYIGTDFEEKVNLGNFFGGVDIISGFNITVGGTEPGQGNIIAYNSEGVFITGGDASVSNAVRGNGFANNTTIPIDLIADGGIEPDGPNTNDPDDIDVGANGLMNKPTVLNTRFDALQPGTVDVDFLVDSAPEEAVFPLTIDAYFSMPDDSPQGRFYLGSTTYSTPQAVMTESFDVGPFSTGYLLLTATDGEDNTSEMSTTNLDVIFSDGFATTP